MAGKKLDLTNKKFDKLLVISFSHIQNGKTFWKCLCDCNNETIVCGAELKRGHVKTCGCRLGIYNTLDAKILGGNNIFHIYKHSSFKRNIEFNLSLLQVHKFIYDKCHYCGSVPCTEYKITTVKSKPIVYYNGIDRIDSSIGYYDTNCVTACKTCNYAKREMSYDEFVAWIGRLIKFHTNPSSEEGKYIRRV
jgi:hypothetical protein